MCRVVEGEPTGASLCCSCRFKDREIFSPVSAAQIRDEAQQATQLLGSVGGAKLKGESRKLEADFRQVAKAAAHGQDEKEEKATVKLEADLSKAKDKADSLGAAGKIPPPSQQQYDQIVDQLLREGKAIDDTAPCPWASVNVGFEIPPGLGAAHCTRITSDPLPEDEFGRVVTLDLAYNARGWASHLPFPATVQLHSPDPGSVFAGDCTAEGVIDLSKVKRPTCNLGCDCRIAGTATSTTIMESSSTTSSTPSTTSSTTPPCAQLDETCRELRPCCFVSTGGSTCEAGRCCVEEGYSCASGSACCNGLSCVGAFGLLLGVCRVPPTTSTSTTSTSAPSTTTTTTPCMGQDQPCDFYTNDCCNGYECHHKQVSPGVFGSFCAVLLPCPGFLQNPPFTITNAVGGNDLGNLYQDAFDPFAIPLCKSAPLSLHAIDVATGTDLSPHPFGPMTNAAVYLDSGPYGPQGNVQVTNLDPSSPGGETKEVYLVLGWQ